MSTYRVNQGKSQMKSIEGVILGELASKSNSRRLVNRGGRPMFIKSQKALDYEKSALLQLKKIIGRNKPMENDVVLEATLVYASKRPDLDESLLMDILQKAGVYLNDRQVKEKHIYWGIDKDNTRVSFIVWEL